MEDLVVKIMRDMNGKDMFYRETCLSGLLAGLAVQTKLVTMGRTYYDGALLARIKSLEGKPVPVLIRSLEHDYSEKLFDDMFVGWESKSPHEKEYFIYFGFGMIWVCKLYESFVTASISWPDIVAKMTQVVDARSAELKRMI